MRHRRLAPALAFVLAFGGGPIAPAIAQTDCDPFDTTPVFDEDVPSLEATFGFDFGEEEVTTAQSNQYVADIAAAAPGRVVAASAGQSVAGVDIPYAVVGTQARLQDLPAVQALIATLRDPNAELAAVEAAIEDAPVILWVAGNVHGGEESGTDASLRTLYYLAARTDCVVEEILANALVVIMPTQNPDGRNENTRRNLYGFDMNRDWFARTQPETDGKLDVVRQYPPMLMLDVHEFGFANYFFPPNADPIYHEIPDQANDWINGLYSPAIVDQFNQEGIRFFHGAPYDFFAIVFGDTVPTTGYHAAGITLEKESGDPIAVREHEHFTAIWASLFAGASNRAALLEAWHESFVDAFNQGEAGDLEPNGVFEPRHKLLQEVPDLTVRSYFILPDEDRAYELQLLVRRLQRMDVEVRQLTAPLALDEFQPYGDDATSAVLPAGTYWISLAQGQKHWIQAMLNEETWIPFDVTFDVTAWSNPLLMNLAGGWTPEDVSDDAVSSVVAPLGEPTWVGAGTVPAVALWEIPISTRGFEAAGHFRYLWKEVWNLGDVDQVFAADIIGGLSDDLDVLVIPDGFANYALQALGAKGKKALRTWVNEGGRIVAWQGGAEVVARSGVSTAKFANANTNMPGTLVRVRLDSASPLAAGVGELDWVMFEDDRSMQPGLGGAVGTFPAPSSADFATSGLAIGVDTLAGTSFLADEAVGNGRVISFSIDPNFRAWTQGTQRLLWNAIVGPDPAPGVAGLFAGSKERATFEKAAIEAASKLLDFGSEIRIRVARADAARTAEILLRRGSDVAQVNLGTETLFIVANRRDLSSHEHPWFALVVRELQNAGVDLRAASLP